MSSKKEEIKKRLIKGSATVAVIAGLVCGGKTAVDMEKLSTAKNDYACLHDRAVASDTYQKEICKADELVSQAYSSGVIDTETFTKKMAENHSENFVYDRRYELLNKEEAMLMEDASFQQDKYMLDMSIDAIASGACFAGSAAILLYLHEKQRNGKKLVMEGTFGDMNVYRLEGSSLRIAVKGGEIFVFEDAKGSKSVTASNSEEVNPMTEMEELVK